MDASILIVGSDVFRSNLLPPILDLAAFTTEFADNSNEAAPLIQAQQPDILLIQASQVGSLELCQQVKAQSRLAWIYCIIVDTAASASADAKWIEEGLSNRVTALEAGADAYLQMTFTPVNDDCSANNSSANNRGQTLQKKLLQTQIQAGLRRVQNHRELMRTNDLLSAIALSDPLTELNNRRAFEWELPRQIHNARSRGMPISLLMLDVDYFKTINDTHGHLVGDRALRLLSARIRHNLRFYDTPFRYGGEEFVIILGDTGSQESSIIAHRLCHLIGDQPFVIDDNLDLSITVSAGTASLQSDDDAKGISLLQRADQHLLLAKSQGRNRVVSH